MRKRIWWRERSWIAIKRRRRRGRGRGRREKTDEPL